MHKKPSFLTNFATKINNNYQKGFGAVKKIFFTLQTMSIYDILNT